MFKTRKGRVYRALFFLENGHVYLLRVRGPGQENVQPDELAQREKPARNYFSSRRGTRWEPGARYKKVYSSDTNTIPLIPKKKRPQKTTPMRMNQLGRTSGGSSVQFTYSA